LSWFGITSYGSHAAYERRRARTTVEGKIAFSPDVSGAHGLDSGERRQALWKGGRTSIFKVMSKPEHHLIMKSVKNRAEIPRGKLGAPGAPTAINIVAIKENETRDDKARLQDQSLRMFNVELLLTKQLTVPDTFNSDFTKEDGTSFIKLATKIKVDTASGTFDAELNSRNEMALIRMRVEACVPTEARNKVYDATAAFLDHLSYLAQAPILTSLMKIYDEKNQVFTIDILGPEQEVTLNPGAQYLFRELSPIYALYREFKNSNSAYYRLLCLFKVMEGIFRVLRKKGREEAKALGIQLFNAEGEGSRSS
jgi:hypothetical protein